MSSKKGKTKVSQADLRKMMQQMKHKKTEVANNSTQNGSNMLKRKVPMKEYFEEKLETNKKLKKTIVSNKPLVQKNAYISMNEKQTDKVRQIVEKEKLSSNPTTKESCSSASNANEQKANVPVRKLQKVQPTGPRKSAAMPLVSGFYSDSSSSDEAENSTTTSIKGNLTNLFKVKVDEDDKNNSSKPESSLPAGFFDDPETDAKMRGVETPADKMDREWETFQKELQHEAVQSEQLIEEEQDTGHLDREIDEIDEQIQYYTRIDKLCDQKDKIFSKTNHDEKVKLKMETDSSSSEDEGDALDSDWREKYAFT